MRSQRRGGRGRESRGSASRACGRGGARYMCGSPRWPRLQGAPRAHKRADSGTCGDGRPRSPWEWRLAPRARGRTVPWHTQPGGAGGSRGPTGATGRSRWLLSTWRWGTLPARWPRPNPRPYTDELRGVVEPGVGSAGTYWRKHEGRRDPHTVHAARTSLCWAAASAGLRNAVWTALGPAPRETAVPVKTVACAEPAPRDIRV